MSEIPLLVLQIVKLATVLGVITGIAIIVYRRSRRTSFDRLAVNRLVVLMVATGIDALLWWVGFWLVTGWIGPSHPATLVQAALLITTLFAAALFTALTFVAVISYLDARARQDIVA